MAKVEYITYKDEKYPVRISYYSIKRFEQETGKKIDDLEKDITLLEVLLWYGLVAGHVAEMKEMTVKREDMEFILDESMSEFNNAIMSFFPLGPVDTEVDSSKKK